MRSKSALLQNSTPQPTGYNPATLCKMKDNISEIWLPGNSFFQLLISALANRTTSSLWHCFRSVFTVIPIRVFYRYNLHVQCALIFIKKSTLSTNPQFSTWLLKTAALMLSCQISAINLWFIYTNTEPPTGYSTN